MKNRALIVSHDAGGAEILAAWRNENGDKYDLLFCVSGPALRVFERGHRHINTVGLEAMGNFQTGDFVLTATSLEASIERDAIKRAKKTGVYCITFLDHWDLYKERFGDELNWRDNLPNEIWVGDNYAYDLALKDGFPKAIIKLVNNPYFDAIKNHRKGQTSLPQEDKKKILYICEPISRKLKVAFEPNSTEFNDEVLIVKDFLKSVAKFCHQVSAVTLRLHPSETLEKYQSVVQPYMDILPLSYSDKTLLVDDIQDHSIIIGVESMGLVIGLIFEKEVYSCITGKQWTISLPHHEIKRIHDFDQLFV